MPLPLLRPETSLLFLIDLQERLLEVMPEEERSRLLQTAQLLLQAAGKLGIPVLLSEQYPKGLGRTVPEVAALLPEGSLRFEKRVFSALRLEGVREALAELSRPQVVLLGVETHVCLLQTVADLLELGLLPFVVADGTCSRDPDHKLYALARMERAGAIITCGEAVVFEWLGSADHPHFREIVGLLK